MKAYGQYTISVVNDGEPGSDGKSQHLHIKYSNDGETFTENNGEELGTWIGTLVDFNEQDSDNFADYTWRRFADDSELKDYVDLSVTGVYTQIDRVENSLSSIYLAKSDFGQYAETVQTSIEQTAKRTVESYDYQAQIDAVNARYGDVDSYVTAIRGEIRRGIITDPETGEEQMGIAISENLSFTGVTRTENGQTYYELSPGQTLGLYTAKGWQFWINGSKRGWFDSADGMLHTANMVVEKALQMGDSWQASTVGGFGIRYIGS